MAREKSRFRDLAMFALPVYVLLILSIGFVFTVANDLTKQEGRLSYFCEVYLMLLYVSATVSILVLEFYVIRNARKRHQVVSHYGIDNKAAATNDIEMRSASDKPDFVENEPDIGLSTQKGANLYFLLGGMGFGLGTILSDILSISDYVRFKEHSCLHELHVAVFIIHALFIANQMVFIGRHHKTVIARDQFLTRFLLLHMLAVNLCVCINAFVRDAAEEYRHETEVRTHDHPSVEHTSGSPPTAGPQSQDKSFYSSSTDAPEIFESIAKTLEINVDAKKAGDHDHLFENHMQQVEFRLNVINKC